MSPRPAQVVALPSRSNRANTELLIRCFTFFSIGRYGDELDQRGDRRARACDEWPDWRHESLRWKHENVATRLGCATSPSCTRRATRPRPRLGEHAVVTTAAPWRCVLQRRCPRDLLSLHLPEQRRVGLAYRQCFGAMLESQMNAPTEVSLHARDLRKVHDD